MGAIGPELTTYDTTAMITRPTCLQPNWAVNAFSVIIMAPKLLLSIIKTLLVAA